MRIRDVAAALKLSVATVSRALNPSTAHLVTERTRRKVQKYVDETGYIPNRAARGLSTGRTNNIGLILPHVQESIFFNDHLIKVLGGVSTVLLEQTHYNCKIVMLPRKEKLDHLDRQVFASGVDGILLSPYCDPRLYSEDYPENVLLSWERPVVVLNVHLEKIKRFNCVYMDNKEAARNAVTHLITKGHRRIAMITGDAFFQESSLRLEGYRGALTDHGIVPDDKWLVAGNFTIEGGYAATLELMKRSEPRPTAIFCANDETAIGALRALRSLEIRVPADMAVMGFDGIDVGGFVDPSLTTISQPTREMAEAGTRLLIDIVEGRAQAPVSRPVPAHLIVRDSV